MMVAGAASTSLGGLVAVLFVNLLRFSTIAASDDPGAMDHTFLVDGVQLLLPELPSKLNFEQVEGFASENDTSAQTELRSTRFWGRMYVDGWPQPIQYFMSHFSGPPRKVERPLLLADPPMACGPLVNADEIRNKSAVILVRRGVCTFGTKARVASEAGATAIVYINDREGLEHASGPDAHDLDLCAVMIPQREGDLLWREIEPVEEEEETCGRAPNARLIPMHCSANNNAFRTGNLCEAVTKEEREYIQGHSIEGGLINGVEGGPMEFLLAHFGSWVPLEPVELVVPPPDSTSGSSYGCMPWDADTDFNGAAVLLERGNCSYLEKALNAQQAGARVVIVANNELTLLRAGAEPRYDGLNVTSTVMTITSQAGERLRQQQQQPITVSFEESSGVRQEVWDELSGLLQKKQWPRHPKRAKELYLKMKDKMIGANQALPSWPERMAALEAGFSQLHVRL